MAAALAVSGQCAFFFLIRSPEGEYHQVTYLQLDLFCLPHFSPLACVTAARANYVLCEKKKNEEEETISDNSHPGAGTLWGTLWKLYLALLLFHLPGAC